jgi:hypothetical protein
MELNQAREVIRQAIEAGLRAGVYSLNDINTIIQAMSKIESVDEIQFGGTETEVAY